MKARFLLPVLVTLASTAMGVELTKFEWRAPLSGKLAVNLPVRVTLPREVISRTDRSMADLRLFGPVGEEVPYVVYEEQEGDRGPEEIQLKLISFSHGKDADVLVLDRAKKPGDLTRIDILTPNRDFKREVVVEAGTNGTTWKEVQRDTIFDFSSQVDLRKTHIELPALTEPMIRLTFRMERKENNSPTMELRYEGLDFRVQGKEGEVFRIDAVRGALGAKRDAFSRHDEASISDLTTRVDVEKKISIISLGEVNMPITHLLLEIGKAAYHRRVEVWGGEEKEEEKHRLLGSGVVYRLPGMSAGETTLEVSIPKTRFLELRIANGDSPPIQLSGVAIRWIRQNLYFIPEKEKGYALHFGGDSVPAPVYDMDQILSREHKKLYAYSSLTVGAVEKNPAYEKPKLGKDRGVTEKIALRLVMAVVVLLLGVWMFRLAKASKPTG